MATVPIYPKKLCVTYGGFVIKGFAKGTFIKQSQEEPSAKAVRGADSHVAVMLSGLGQLKKVSITLLQTSKSNEMLTAQHALQQDGGPGLPLSISYVSGSKTLISQAFIEKMPDSEWSDDVSNREWTFLGQADIDLEQGIG